MFLTLYFSICTRLLIADGIFVISVCEMTGKELIRDGNYVCVGSSRSVSHSLALFRWEKSNFAVFVNKYLRVCPIQPSIEESSLYYVCYMSFFPTDTSVQKSIRENSVKNTQLSLHVSLVFLLKRPRNRFWGWTDKYREHKNDE
jgi:hypothetical protein